MTILFVDDDPDDRELFCEGIEYLNKNESFYRTQNIECIPLNEGRKAMELISTMSVLPDFIFLDINMPIMDGRECLKLLKTNNVYNTIPVVIFSTSFSKSDQEVFSSMGAVACIKKPTEFLDLVKILSKYVYSSL